MSQQRGRGRDDNDFLNMLNDWDVSRTAPREERPAERGGGGEVEASDAASLLGSGRAPKRRRRAKTGKRSNPDWTLASCYVEKKVYWAVREGLAARQRELGRKVDYSELVNGLLKEWCEEQGIDPEESGEA